jgi:hypothetical protein
MKCIYFDTITKVINILDFGYEIESFSDL